MKNQDNRSKQVYNSPKLERYGNVRDLTQFVTGSINVHGDNGHAITRTH
jgi:hypothetical protein